MAEVLLSLTKLLFILLYAGFGAFCFFLARRDSSGQGIRIAGIKGSWAPSLALPVIAAGLLLMKFAMSGSYPLVAAVVIATAIFTLRHRAWRTPLDQLRAAIAATLVLSLAWWRIEPTRPAPLPLVEFALILAGLTIGFSDRGKRSRSLPAIPLAVVLIAGLLLLIDLGGYRPNTLILAMLAHHWGAFIGPALHVNAGLVPFYDVPLQYGLGPTFALAAACRDNFCWTGAEVIFVIMNLAGALLILRMALATSIPRGWLWRCAVTAVMFAALFLWLGFPSNGSGLMATPSVGGIRFFPVTLVAYLLFFGFARGAAAALVPAVLWSPESAAMSIAVFGLCETARIGPVRAALRSAGVLAGSYATLLLLHRAIFGIWIDPAAFAEYVLHVPGPLPIDPLSDILLLIGVLGLGASLLVHASPDSVTAGRNRAAIFLLFAAASYWLGRSDPNNICNLAPFLALVGLRALDRQAGERSSLASVTSFGLAASAAALALSPWHSVPYDPRATVDIRAVVAEFGTLQPDIERIRREIPNPGHLGIADFGPSFMRHPSETLVWTPMDPSSLWSYVPSARRQLYIRRSAARLRRSGWAIAQDAESFMLDDLLAGYAAAERLSFDGASMTADGPPAHYFVVCFDPRPDVAGSIIGPSCPHGAP